MLGGLQQERGVSILDDGEVDDAEHMPLVRTQFASSLGADIGRNGIDPGGKLGIT